MNIREILAKNSFYYKKSLGQNFITDTNLLESIVKDAQINESDTVLEIGAGAGTLTKALSKTAGRVISFEVDKTLQPVLQQVLKDCDNVSLFFKDIQKISDKELLETAGKSFKVVANLPYYITTPIVMRFVESKTLDAKSLTFMVQKEVAKRLTAKEGTSDYGAITLAVKLRGDAKITRVVDKKSFFPIPKVDSAVVHIEMTRPYDLSKYGNVLKLIKSAFAMRRKTLLNNIVSSMGLSRQEALEVLKKADLDEKIRGEKLPLEKFLYLSTLL